jgi:hypothetical protein
VGTEKFTAACAGRDCEEGTGRAGDSEGVAAAGESEAAGEWDDLLSRSRAESMVEGDAFDPNASGFLCTWACCFLQLSSWHQAASLLVVVAMLAWVHWIRLTDDTSLQASVALQMYWVS